MAQKCYTIPKKKAKKCQKGAIKVFFLNSSKCKKYPPAPKKKGFHVLLQTAPNGLKWFKIAPNGFKKRGLKWLEMTPNSSKWLRIYPNGSKWLEMAQNDSK